MRKASLTVNTWSRSKVSLLITEVEPEKVAAFSTLSTTSTLVKVSA
ncbi:hypothetical protein [Methylomonas koyamae]|nr:hypothetical protein [Methylomonas koyamae]